MDDKKKKLLLALPAIIDLIMQPLPEITLFDSDSDDDELIAMMVANYRDDEDEDGDDESDDNETDDLKEPLTISPISSISDDDSDHEILTEAFDFHKTKSVTIMPQYNDGQFKLHFHMDRSTIEFLIQNIGAELNDDHEVRSGRRKKSGDINVLLPVWILANQESFKSICSRFEIGGGHGYRIFCQFCTALSAKLNDFVTWPTYSQILRNISMFEKLKPIAFPGVVGCIDSTYIRIRGLKSQETYCTTKNFKAVILQAICDHEKKFIDVFTGLPGSNHDGVVWKHSNIYKNIIQNRENFLPNDTYILGDNAYTLEDFLMVPYNSFLTPKQKFFNSVLNSYREVTDDAFGLLKSRFRRLRYLNMTRTEFATEVITSACILHNICIDHNDVIENIEPDHDLTQNEMLLMEDGNEYTKREEIANLLFASRQ